MSIKAIIEGNINNITRSDSHMEQLAESRLAICKTCSARRYSTSFKTYMCSRNANTIHAQTGMPVHGCGCPINSKTRQNDEPCPAMKWDVEK